MRHANTNPLYRSFIGFDRLASLVNDTSKKNAHPSYPPYNIERIEHEVEDDRYEITIAVAGFDETELSIQEEQHTLTVEGKKAAISTDKPQNFLHRGIGQRNFKRVFQLGEHVKVTQAKLELGQLVIGLARDIPEAQKAKKISINAQSSNEALTENLQH